MVFEMAERRDYRHCLLQGARYQFGNFLSSGEREEIGMIILEIVILYYPDVSNRFEISTPSGRIIAEP